MKTRSQVLRDITSRAVRDRRLQVLDFAGRVAELYLARVGADARVVKFREMSGDMDQALASQRHNGQIVDRLLKGVVKSFPADLEEVWVECLPPVYRQEALRELAARYCMLPATIPGESPREQVATLSALMKSFGISLESLSPVLEDGKIDQADAPFLSQAISDVDNHVASCITVRTCMVNLVDALKQEGEGA